MSVLNRTSFDVFHLLSDFAETFQRCDMVHPWRGLCTLAIPPRCRNNVYHDVSQHPIQPSYQPYLNSPQQPLLG